MGFGGWEMPVQYSGIREEHVAVREKAGLFDVGHMGEVFVSGPEAAGYLDYLLPQDFSRALPGKGIYAPMCQADGGVVDDLIAYCLEPERFLLVVNAANREKDVKWMEEHAEGFDCKLEDVSDRWGLLALQGPEAESILARLVEPELSGLPRFGIGAYRISGEAVRVARTGYTGEPGFEILVPAEDAERLAESILEAGISSGLKLAGLGCRDSLRLEAGLPLYGHEISETLDPLSAGLGWTVKFSKGVDFVGREALRRLKESGLESRVRHFIVEDRRMAREGMPVLDGEDPAGKVLSGAFSPLLGKPIGSCLLETASVGSNRLAVEIRNRAVPIRLKKTPLHR